MEKQISHFKILEEIGSGGMGVVYRARDLRLRRKVALKVLPAGALAEPMIRERLMREAQTTSALNHPHIVTVFEIHSAGDRDFIAMEYVEGQSLDHVIGDEGLPLEQALRYAIQIADGLACAHEQGVIHRDLKPQNVMISPADEVKILDFGLAKRFLPAGASESSVEPGLMTLTAPGVKVGTPAYMSPEQIESKHIDARSDVFSFGCLLYQMLSGVTPFQRRNAILIFKAVLSDQPVPLRSLKPKLPVGLERILIRAMEKSPEDRYQSMRELLVELEEVHAKVFGTGVFPIQAGVPAPRRLRAGAGWPLALAALGLLAAGLTGWWLSRSENPSELSGHRAITSARGAPRQAAFSPSGDRIVFIDEDSAGVAQVWSRALAGGSSTQVTTGEAAAEHPRWSPAEAGSLIFGASAGGVWSTAAEGGSLPRRVLERGTDPRLSPDGSLLAVEIDGRIWTAGADGSALTPMTSVPATFFARWTAMSPAFSPDGSAIAFFRPEAGSHGDLWIAPVDTGDPRRLVGRTFRGGDPTWTAGGGWIVFWADFTGEVDLWSVPARGGEPVQLTYGAGRHTAPELSADGRRLVYGVAHPAFTLERRDSVSGERRQLVAPRRFEIVRPEVSPAGDQIAFSSPAGPAAIPGGGADVHLFVADGGGGFRRVTAGPGESNVLPRWSADGSHLYYHQERPTRSLRKIPAAGGDSTVMLENWSWQLRYDTAVGPREERVVYTPIADGEPQPLRVRDLTSGEERQLGAVLLAPRWSPDGGSVLGSDGDDRIYLCPAAGGDCRFLAEGSVARWGPEGRSITFIRRSAPAARGRAQPVSIWRLSLDGLTGSKLAEVEAASLLTFGYGFLAGGDLVWNRVVPGSEELWMAEVR